MVISCRTGRESNLVASHTYRPMSAAVKLSKMSDFVFPVADSSTLAEDSEEGRSTRLSSIRLSFHVSMLVPGHVQSRTQSTWKKDMGVTGRGSDTNLIASGSSNKMKVMHASACGRERREKRKLKTPQVTL